MKSVIRAVVAAAAVLGCVQGCAATDASGDGDFEASESNLNSELSVLAVGDSITWGGNPRLEAYKLATQNGLKGYPELLAAAGGGRAANGACPGETSYGFVSWGEPNTKDNGCHTATAGNQGTPFERDLRVGWGGAPNQIGFLKKALATRTPSLITVSLGGNDLFVMQKNEGATAIRAYGQGIEANYGKIFAAIEEAGYTGAVAVVNVPKLVGASWLTGTAMSYFNSWIKQAVDKANARNAGPKYVYVDMLSAFDAAKDGSKCLNLFNPYTEADMALPGYGPEDPCDVHPSKRGYQVLAKAVLDAVRPVVPALANATITIDP